MPPSLARLAPPAFVALLFFLSGAAGLAYEVLWSRRLELTFGSTSQSIGVVLAAYMAGLGLGAWALGRAADRPGSALTRYAVLEAGIGVWGLLAPWVLDGCEAIYVSLAGAGGLATRALLGLCALLPATFLMGGTLPVLARALIDDRAETQRAVGVLYGINTLGAVCGALAASFLLIEALGLDEGSRFVGAANLLLALAALTARGRLRLAPPPGSGRGLPAQARERPLPLALQRLALAVTCGVGAVALALEVAWTRAISLAVGTSGHAFSVMLAATLSGIGLGSLLVARRPRDARAPLAPLVGALLLLGGANVLFLLCFDRLPALFFALAQPRFLYYEQLLLVGFGVCAVLLLPATVAMGLAFPLAAQLGTSAAASAGRSVGRIYLANTVGAIAGSFLGSFLLLPWIGSEGILRLGIALLALGAVGAARVARAHGRWGLRRARLAAALGGLLGLAALPAVTPPWNPRRLDLDPWRARVAGPPTAPGEFRRALTRGGTAQLYAREGRNAFVTIRANSQGISLTLSGKADASNMGDMGTQLLCGLLPFLAQPGARTVLVVGAGSGVSARVAAEVPSVRRLDLVEIEEAIVEASGRYFRAENHGVFSRENVRVIYEDARTHILTARGRYDVIISEPTNPFISGVANLFTREHYRNVLDRLAPDGVHLQWIQTYDSDDWMLRAMARTFCEVFPHVDLWWASPGDLLLLGARGPLRYSLEAPEHLVASCAGLEADLERYLQVRRPTDLWARFLLHEDELRPLVADAAILSDRFPLLEGHAARARYVSAIGYTFLRDLYRLRLARSSFWPRGLAGAPRDDDALRIAAVRAGWAQGPDALAVLEGIDHPEAVWLRTLARDPEAAGEATLRAALERYGEDPLLLRGLALAAERRGGARAAAPWLARLEAIGADEDPEVHRLRALLAVRTRGRAGAATAAAEVAAGLRLLGPSDREAALRGKLLWVLPAAPSPEAVELLEGLLADRPWDLQASLALVDLQLAAGRPAPALERLEALLASDFRYERAVRERYLEALSQLGRRDLPQEVRRFLDDFPRSTRDPRIQELVRAARAVAREAR